jgi:hypothetical protein
MDVVFDDSTCVLLERCREEEGLDVGPEQETNS